MNTNQTHIEKKPENTNLKLSKLINSKILPLRRVAKTNDLFLKKLTTTQSLLQKQIKTRNKRKHATVTLIITNSNLHSTIATPTGRLLFRTSSGLLGYKSTIKKNYVAFESIAKEIAKQVIRRQINEITIAFKGAQRLRRQFLRKFKKFIHADEDKTKATVRIKEFINYAN